MSQNFQARLYKNLLEHFQLNYSRPVLFIPKFFFKFYKEITTLSSHSRIIMVAKHFQFTVRYLVGCDCTKFEKFESTYKSQSS